MNYLGFLDFGGPELFVILAIVLLLFGGKKLPELANSIGKSAGELKKGISDAADLRDTAKGQVNELKQTWQNGNRQLDEKAENKPLN